MPKGKNKQLDLSDRLFIEDRMRLRDSSSEIARRLGVSPSTVSREVERNRVPHSPAYQACRENLCSKAAECAVAGLCGTGCLAPCRKCRKGPSTCNGLCPDFAPRPCPQLDRPPFRRDTCHRRYGGGCGHPTLFYDGRAADELARRRLSESRAGLGVSAQQLADMDRLVTPLVRKGQSPGAIWATHAAELPVGPRTYYRYVDAGVMTCANIDLPRKVRFRPRKKGPRPARPVCGLEGRLYSDFEALPDCDKFLSWQMDCVEGARGEAPALLTLTFPRPCLQLVMLLDSQDQEHVGAALDGLEAALGGPAEFAGVFGTILTDRGHEFLDPERIEASPTGERRCRVFYCDPLQSTQKSFCERNHAELRRILPKGTPIGGMTRADVALLASHLNSYKRPETGWAAPLALGLGVFPTAIFDALGMGLVEPDDVTMSPSLLAHVPGMPSQPRASHNRNKKKGPRP